MTGIIPLKKGENITSFFAVNKVRRIIGEKKCGHTGTLDPNATGVLPIAVGGATRFIELLPTHKKAYKATFKTGFCTDTLDIWGTVTETFNKEVSFEEIEKAASEFKGEIMQLPPMYSAIKRDGVRLYELARQGIEVERAPRKCEIYELSVEKAENEGYSLYCECSAGTYIRTLINDIGEKLGCGATMTSLCRTFACGIEFSECFTLEELNELKEAGEIEKAVIPLENLLLEYPEIQVTENQSKRFSNGGSLMRERIRNIKDNGIYRVYGNGEFLGLGELTDTDLLVKRVYNNV
ncbi:MAG: tRNA pseudouridine(55) synthase TruB [Ruminococcaceae bacterium]|nr:tRNA pseudouridine(55) synthase TruB [Oscillospiraceae bacterium]